ncbi:hypothetical protein TNCV_1529861 [Trichonephila clavipes]|uniref:Uncharacterized protein n=1 Tax=Trichonephila clavipes TaxID=2585209 RepID=A0A8X6VGF8_TRICX|nr:hypothetical protein TNCV_1529861 [Trichonephila clavipes]
MSDQSFIPTNLGRIDEDMIPLGHGISQLDHILCMRGMEAESSGYDVCERGDHERSLRGFPMDFLCPSQGLGKGAFPPLSSDYIRLVGGGGFLTVSKVTGAMTGDKISQYLGVPVCIETRLSYPQKEAVFSAV